MTPRAAPPGLAARAAVHAALGEPVRLAVIDELTLSDRSPRELCDLLGVGSNLMAHHLDVLEGVGLIIRSASAGDGRRRYVQLRRDGLRQLRTPARAAPTSVVFLCTANSARSQLAAAIWRARTGRPASSAGTAPAARVHRGAVAAARRAGLSLDGATPSALGSISRDAQVVTVCDLVHETVQVRPEWWHWSIPDPVAAGDDASFDAVVRVLGERIDAVASNAMEGSDG